MEKLKYDSLYKFIVSIGIAIIVLPFIFMYIVINSNDIVVISNNDINQLTDTAKEIILLEQNFKYMVLSNSLIFTILSIIFIVIGLIIVVYGIVEWKNKVQKYEDRSRELNNKLLETQIKDLTKEEKEEKIIEDIEISEIKDKLNNNNQSIKKQKISKYVSIQESVYKIIRKVFKNYKIFEEVKLENQSFDCIALDISSYYTCDYIFEIKYFSTIKSIKGKIKSLEDIMVKEEILYYENSKRFAKTVLIIVVDNFTEKDRLENIRLLEEIKRTQYMAKIIIGDIDEIEKELKKIQNI